MNTIRFKACEDVNPKQIRLPVFATDGSGCFDFHAIEHCSFGMSRQSAVLRTGLIPEVPEGWVMLIFSRSGHGFKNDVRLSNCVGVIDSDYRAEIKVKLRADTAGFFEVAQGTAIAQGLLVPAPIWSIQVILDQSVQLSETKRGAGGFGSTDRKFFGQSKEN